MDLKQIQKEWEHTDNGFYYKFYYIIGNGLFNILIYQIEEPAI